MRSVKDHSSWTKSFLESLKIPDLKFSDDQDNMIIGYRLRGSVFVLCLTNTEPH